MTIKLEPGDYVITDIDEDTYHLVGKAFIKAGADAGEFPDTKKLDEWYAFGWCQASNRLVHRERSGFLRQLTVDHILGTANPACIRAEYEACGAQLHAAVELLRGVYTTGHWTAQHLRQAAQIEATFNRTNTAVFGQYLDPDDA